MPENSLTELDAFKAQLMIQHKNVHVNAQDSTSLQATKNTDARRDTSNTETHIDPDLQNDQQHLTEHEELR